MGRKARLKGDRRTGRKARFEWNKLDKFGLLVLQRQTITYKGYQDAGQARRAARRRMRRLGSKLPAAFRKLRSRHSSRRT